MDEAPSTLKHDGHVVSGTTDAAGRALWRSARQVRFAADAAATVSEMSLKEAGAYLARILDGPRGKERVVLTRAEAEVIADLLDELAARLEAPATTLDLRDHVGTICRELSVRIWDRLGI